ncbi:MAG: hypothetical protein AAF696_28390, partial [Bacteroidota bacterium]
MKYTFSTLLILPFIVFLSHVHANDCGSAANLSLGTPTSIVLDGCDNGDLAGGVYPCANCASDAWFVLDLGGTNLIQQHVRFNIEANGSAELNLVLMYSDSWEESGDPCTWSNAGGSAIGLSRNINNCAVPITGIGDIIEFDSYGLDGSGQYVLLVERTTAAGTANTITVTPQIIGTCNAPANDRCASPLALGSGNGIDPAAPSPNVPSWADAMKASTACGTKQRITRTTPGNPATGIVTTEDHYNYRRGGRDIFVGNIGDGNRLFGRPLSQADTYLENTLYYSFTVPGSGTNSDWNLAIGNTGGCSQEPNDMVVMIFNSLDCSDADNSNLRESQKISMNNGVPAGNASYIFDNLTLTGGSTYYVVVDGTRGSQCDFCMLLYNGAAVNPALPAELTNFQGFNQGIENILSWETSLEDQHDYFGVEKSTDGENFEEISRVQGLGNVEQGQAYQFIDSEAKVGINYYRLNMVDIDGTSFYSKTIQIHREAPAAALISLYPNPSREFVELYFASDQRK